MAAAIARDTDNRLLNAALQFATRGNPVFPVEAKGKRPLVEHGLHDATIDEKQLCAWWAKWPNANVGLPTGARSKLVVVDIDGTTGESSWEALVADHGDTPTLTALTGGDGLHLIYEHPGEGIEIRNSAGKLGPGIDTRGDGGYIVAPPSIHPTGQTYEWLDTSIAIAPLPEWIRDELTRTEPAPAAPTERRVSSPANDGSTTRYARVALDAQVSDVAGAGQGQRNHTLNQAAFRMGQLVAGGQINEQTVDIELTDAAARCGLTGVEIARTIRSGLTSGAREPQYPDPSKLTRKLEREPSTSRNEHFAPSNEEENCQVPDDDSSGIAVPDGEPPGPPEREVVDDEDDPDGEINETDLGNARRLIRRHGFELRYATHLRGWLRWDGRRWKHDDDGYVQRCMHATAQSIVAEIAELSDPDAQKKRFGWAIKSESARAIDNAIDVASTLRGTPVGAQDLDADPWLINVRNGTIDLRTGQLRPHRPADLLTKLAPVDYDPDSQDDRWDAYLASALPDPELVDWVQRAVGYTLTGDTTEEVLFFVHGPTRAGKSTFLEAIKATLGDYARNADFETFLDRDHGGTARGDIARLAGARLVTSNEVDEGRRLAEGLVKTLTGGDTITARFLYRDEFEYSPQFKLWLAANHKPKVRHGDDAIWRRMRLVPFVHPPQVVDPELKAHLSSDGTARAAILAWAVTGCTQWQARGLRSATAVRAATEAYRAEQDPLAEFFEDHCAFDPADPNCWVLASDLRKAYESWAAEQGIKRTLGSLAFRQLLEDRGCDNDRKRIDGKTQRIWIGLRLLADFEERAQLPGISVAPVANEPARDTRDGRDGTSDFSPNARAREERISETPSRTSRASRGTVTDATALGDNVSEPSLVDADVPPPDDDATASDAWVECSGNCGRLVLPAPGSVAKGFRTYCDSCEPF